MSYNQDKSRSAHLQQCANNYDWQLYNETLQSITTAMKSLIDAMNQEQNDIRKQYYENLILNIRSLIAAIMGLPLDQIYSDLDNVESLPTIKHQAADFQWNTKLINEHTFLKRLNTFLIGITSPDKTNEDKLKAVNDYQWYVRCYLPGHLADGLTPENYKQKGKNLGILFFALGIVAFAAAVLCFIPAIPIVCGVTTSLVITLTVLLTSMLLTSIIGTAGIFAMERSKALRSSYPGAGFFAMNAMTQVKNLWPVAQPITAGCLNHPQQSLC